MHAVETTIAKTGLPAVPGAPTGYVPGIMLHEAELLGALAPHEALIDTWLQCGGYQSADVGGAITEIDIADGKLWTADNTALIRESNPAVMGGRKRWVTSAQAAEGFRGTLASAPSTWSGYTLIVPDFEPNTLALNNAIFSVGNAAATRMTWYVDTSGRIRITHGTSGNTPNFNGQTLAAGTRYSLILTQVTATGVVAAYINNNTPVTADTYTVTLTPPNATVAGILGSADDNVDSNARASQVIAIREAITDTDTLAAIMAACAKIRTYAA